MKTLLEINIFFAVFFAWQSVNCEVPKLIGYDKSSPSNVIAAVVGYQEKRYHPSGIEVPCFSIQNDAGRGKETGILFCIVAPTNYSGYLFWIKCPRDDSIWHDQSVPSAFQYPKDKLFQFKLDDPIVQDILRSGKHLSPDIEYTTRHLNGFPYFWRYQDAVAFATTNKLKLAKCNEALPKLKKKLLEEKQRELLSGVKSELRRELAKAIGDMISDIASLEYNIRETEQQIERLDHSNREQLRILDN